MTHEADNPLRRWFEFGEDIRLPRGKPPSVESRVAVWHEVKDRLLRAWIRKHPGSRPWVWWEHDAPEIRRRIDGKPHPFENPAYIAKAKRIKQQYPNGLDLMQVGSFGLPAYSSERKPKSTLYESQEDYLRRLGLMLPGEDELIEARGGPEPLWQLR